MSTAIPQVSVGSKKSGVQDETEKLLELYGRPVVEKVTEIDEKDKNSPDEWVPRHPEMLRLTGLHPFNSEPKVPMLMEKGWLTPTSLHYVRNHGAVPQLSWDTHTVDCLDLDGNLVKSISMDEIEALPKRVIPVTLTCAGNRRKEQNVVKKSIGFSWGCGAVSNSIWGGVTMKNFLKHLGLLTEENLKRAKYVCFEGADELPKGNGRYGTSIAIETVMDDSRDVMIAYEQNGEKLLPDHGFPVRVLIPGFIGGRMVKWLKKIWLSEVESDNHYHYFDNRVLPPQIDENKANEGKWWYKPEYIINDRNINSAVTHPTHNEFLSLSSKPSEKYTVKGYAYNGGGRRITRVEVSLDSGETWELTNLTQPEQDNGYGKYWCWSFWNLEIDTIRLLSCKEIAVRAWDESTNVQPGNLTWNVMGMMNNPWFKVKIQPLMKQENGETDMGLLFKHPATIEAGGWMEDEKPAEPEVEVAKKVAPKNDLPSYTMDEVKKHITKEDCWIVINEKVYACENWLADHPGGETSIFMNAGKDCTEMFDTIHSQKAKAMLDDWVIGNLAKSAKI